MCIPVPSDQLNLSHIKDTRGSAIAEGLHDALVSRNSATTKLEN